MGVKYCAPNPACSQSSQRQAAQHLNGSTIDSTATQWLSARQHSNSAAQRQTAQQLSDLAPDRTATPRLSARQHSNSAAQRLHPLASSVSDQSQFLFSGVITLKLAGLVISEHRRVSFG